MTISKKIVKLNNKIDIITTNYNPNFLTLRNNKGRKVYNYENLTEEHFRFVKQNRINKLLNTDLLRFEQLSKLNEFKYFLTIHINKKDYKRLIDKLKKADKNFKYISLASYSLKSDLHYHILMNTNLCKEEFENRLKHTDYNFQLITNYTKLLGYFRKNIVQDTIAVLNSNDLAFKDKQIDILKHSKLLNYSMNITKAEIVKNPTDKQIQDIKEIYELDNVIEYNKANSRIQIDTYYKR